jgi:hypothetical protein
MKAKKFYILLITMLLSTQLFAVRTTFKERTEKWLTTAENGRPGIDGDDEQTPPPGAPSAPIGDALVPILLLTLAYGIINKKRQGRCEL